MIAEFWLGEVVQPFSVDRVVRVNCPPNIEQPLEQSRGRQHVDEHRVFLHGKVLHHKQSLELRGRRQRWISGQLFNGVEKLFGFKFETICSAGIGDHLVDDLEYLVVVAVTMNGFDEPLEVLHELIL